MRILSLVSALFVIGTSLSADGLLDKSLATVKYTKTEQISVKKFESQIDLIEKATKTKIKVEDQKKILDSMIDDLLFAQAAEKDLITVSNVELDQALAQKRAQYGFQTDDQLKQAIVLSGQTWEAYRQLVQGQILKEKYLRAKRPKAFAEQTASDAEIMKIYGDRIKDFTVPPMIQFDHLFVKTAGLKNEETAALKAKFENMAKEIKAKGEVAFKDYYSKALTDKDYFASNGIILNDPSFSKQYGDSFVETVFKLKKDQISGVVNSNFGFHIILVRSVEDYRLVKIDEVLPGEKITAREQIRAYIQGQKKLQAQAVARSELSAELRKQSDVKIDQKYVWKE